MTTITLQKIEESEICFKNSYGNGHEFESIGHSEIIDRYTIAVEYECVICGKTDWQYYEIELENDNDL